MSDNFLIPKIHPDKIRVWANQLGGLDNGHYDGRSYELKPFTGYEVHAVYPNGQIKLETEWINGEYMGWENVYYENGNPKGRVLHAYGDTIYRLEYDINNNLTFELTPTPEHLKKMKKLYPIDDKY